MTKTINPVWNFGHWILEFICYLGFEIWNFLLEEKKWVNVKDEVSLTGAQRKPIKERSPA